MYLSLADIDLQLDEHFNWAIVRLGKDMVGIGLIIFLPLNISKHRVKYFDHYLGKLIVDCAGSSNTPL